MNVECDKQISTIISSILNITRMRHKGLYFSDRGIFFVCCRMMNVGCDIQTSTIISPMSSSAVHRSLMRDWINPTGGERSIDQSN